MQSLLVASAVAWSPRPPQGLRALRASELLSPNAPAPRVHFQQPQACSDSALRLTGLAAARCAAPAARTTPCCMVARGKPTARRSKADPEPAGPAAALLQGMATAATGTATVAGALVIAAFASLILAAFAALFGVVIAVFAVSA